MHEASEETDPRQKNKHNLIVNKTLIEMAVLLLLAFLPSHFTFGIDRLIKRTVKKFHSEPVKEPFEHVDSSADHGRRELIKDLIGLPVLGGFIYAAFIKRKWKSFEERHLVSQPSRVDAITGASPKAVIYAGLDKLEGQVPKGKIGDYEISRIIAGGNLISGFAHARGLIYVSHLVQTYFTDEKVIETFKLCEACGINTMIVRVDANTLRILEKYRKRNGKMHWIAYKVLGAGAIHPGNGFRYAFENGADFCCVGMFDFQVVEDANIAINLLKETLPRVRAWYA